MTIAEYRKANPRCEVLPWFPFGISSTRHDQYGRFRLIRYSNGQDVMVPNNSPATETHHILGSGNGAKRNNHASNVIRVCNAAHVWLESEKRAGQVLSLYVKMQKSEVDWEVLTKISGKLYPGCLDTDAYAEACKPWHWIEEFRQELLAC